MSAKPAKKSAKKNPPSATSVPAKPAPSAANAQTTPIPPGAAAVASTAWIDSSDPRKRMIGKLVLVGLWIYVAALWLLALDQTFNWGIFGPKMPVVP